MSATPENDKDHNKGALDDGESEELKQTDINPDSVQSQAVTKQNLQMQQGGSPSEKTSELALANDLENLGRIEELQTENSYLKKENKEPKEKNEFLETENNSLQEQIDTLKQVQTEQTDIDEKWYAESCQGFIFSTLKSFAKKMERSLVEFKMDTEEDISKLPTYSGFYMICSRVVSGSSTVDYPIFIGVATNFKLVFLTLKSKKDKTGNTIFARVLGTNRTFPGNRNKIQGLESGLHICMLEMTYPASKCLKESLLGEFNFCLNQKMNNGLRLKLEISGQKENDEVIDYITKRGRWRKGIDECKTLEVS